MAIIAPSEPADEFILTDNSYNVFEGPNKFVQDIDTGEVNAAAYTPLHEFAPVSPKLMIVLRCLDLPNPIEDAQSEKTHMERAFRRFMGLELVHGFGVRSLLHDLPVSKAGNSYTRVLPNGRLVLEEHEDGRWRRDHKFCFRFFKIGRAHVDTINAILLENCASVCTSVVFESQVNFARTLEAFLSVDCKLGKVIIGHDADAMEATMKKFAQLSKGLGSKTEEVWMRVEPPKVKDLDGWRRRRADERKRREEVAERRRKGLDSVLNEEEGEVAGQAVPRQKNRSSKIRQAKSTSEGPNLEFRESYNLLGMSNYFTSLLLSETPSWRLLPVLMLFTSSNSAQLLLGVHVPLCLSFSYNQLVLICFSVI